MANESKKTIYEARDELIKTENYTPNSRRYPPRDRVTERIPEEWRDARRLER